jgi:hypothetical protein
MQDLPWGIQLREKRLSKPEQLIKLVTEVGQRPALIYVYSPKCYYSQVGSIQFEKAVKELRYIGEPLGTDVPSGEYFANHVYIYNAVPTVLKLVSKTENCVPLERFKNYIQGIQDVILDKNAKNETVTQASQRIIQEFYRISDLYRNQRIECMSIVQFKTLQDLIKNLDPNTTDNLELFFTEFRIDERPTTFGDIFDDPVRQAHVQFQEIILGSPITHYPMIVGLSYEGRVVEYDGPVTGEALYIFMAALNNT